MADVKDDFSPRRSQRLRNRDGRTFTASGEGPMPSLDDATPGPWPVPHDRGQRLVLGAVSSHRFKEGLGLSLPRPPGQAERPGALTAHRRQGSSKLSGCWNEQDRGICLQAYALPVWRFIWQGLFTAFDTAGASSAASPPAFRIAPASPAGAADRDPWTGSSSNTSRRRSGRRPRPKARNQRFASFALAGTARSSRRLPQQRRPRNRSAAGARCGEARFWTGRIGGSRPNPVARS